MAILYKDEYVTCDEDAIAIHQYYFPFGSKRIPYTTIQHIEEEPMDLLMGGLRLWGMGLAPYWFHLDIQRPNKNRLIVVDFGEWIKAVITPANHDAVIQILRQKTAIY